MGVLIAYGVGHIGCRSSGRIILEVGVFSDISAGYAVFYNGVAIACYPAGTVSARAVIRFGGNVAEYGSFICASCDGAGVEMSYHTSATATVH